MKQEAREYAKGNQELERAYVAGAQWALVWVLTTAIEAINADTDWQNPRDTWMQVNDKIKQLLEADNA